LIKINPLVNNFPGIGRVFNVFRCNNFVPIYGKTQKNKCWAQAKAARIPGMTPRQIANRIQTLNIELKQL
jgi:hypothetical protein